MLTDDATLDIPAGTKSQAGNIKAINKDTVHKICSGQVVLSLAIAVKELVENAIDAGATLVEVKLRDQGLEAVEVSDNGCGVDDKNLQAMTAKYHTSKLREFIDLQGVETFGFRGEALSSLCALTDMQIVTRHKNAETAIKVELDHEGNIKQKSPCARAVGTTVTLTNLFTPLPVRRREFTRNIKKEFNKMCQLLQAYCLVSIGVRIICTNTTTKNVKSNILQTHGVGDVLANVTSLFGSKQTASVLRLKSPYAEQGEELTESDLQAVLGDSVIFTAADLEYLNQQPLQLEGYVSKCSHGDGRVAKDRQFFYINSRPCDSKNLSKTVNDIYHRFNAQQYPFVYLNVLTARQAVDVNLTPDKRQLLLQNEKVLLLALKLALLKTYDNTPASYKLQNASITSMLRREEQLDDSVDTDDERLIPITNTQNFLKALKQYSGNSLKCLGKKRKFEEPLNAKTEHMKKVQRLLSLEKSDGNDDSLNESVSEMHTISCGVQKPKENSITNAQLKCLEFKPNKLEINTQNELENDEKVDVDEEINSIFTVSVENEEAAELMLENELKEDATCVLKNDEKPDIVEKEKELKHEKQTDLSQELSSSQSDSQSCFDSSIIPAEPCIVLDDDVDDETPFIENSVAELRITIEDIERQVQEEQVACEQRKKSAKLARLRFKSEIKPTENSKAEAELQKEISKSDFECMQVLGQFNLGFIIVKLATDLFIVDQHATDEKYNFETLQQHTILQYQKLAVPQMLELTAVNELVLMQHLDIFERNGFKFEIDESATTTQRVRLLGKPFSKNWQFGKEDIDELIFMLQDAPEGTQCRPSRIRAMFASRACRKSVMIGTALNKKQMRTLIKHMGEIEQPWNCPHGRPTMRHLINIQMLNDDENEEFCS